MTRYEFRIDYSDETYQVSTVFADSVLEARMIAERDPEVESVSLLCIVDQAPQTAFAFGGVSIGDDSGYDLNDPKHPSFHDTYSGYADGR